jgi:hypothetical protein
MLVSLTILLISILCKNFQQIVDARFKNNYPSFDNNGKRIAWISTEKIKTNPFTVYQQISQIYLGNWMGETLLDDNIGQVYF